MRWSALLLVVALGLGLAGCRANCKDACQHIAECNQKLTGRAISEADVETCNTSCQNDLSKNCAERAFEATDCLASVKCESESGVVAEIAACAQKCRADASGN